MSAALSVDSLSKVYKLFSGRQEMALELLTGRKRHRERWALQDISFAVPRGRVVGVIGRNGSGKSTLLKIIAGTLSKTSGVVQVNGRVSAVLELGTGFHPDFSGRQNVYMGGMCLGMRRRDIDTKLAGIIEFSELADVIDDPFKTYSSGMKARLTFATAIAADFDILVIDEALAAGDQFFVAKCVRRIEEICRSGATVLFVSHAMALVERLCDEAIWIDSGRLLKQGATHEVCRAYLQSAAAAAVQEMNAAALGKRLGTGAAQITDLTVSSSEHVGPDVLRVGAPCRFSIQIDSRIEHAGACAFLQVATPDGQVVFSTHSSAYIDQTGTERTTPVALQPGLQVVEVDIPALWLAAGRYYVSAGVAPHERTNSYNEFFDVQLERWAIAVEREGLVQSTLFEQPVTAWRRRASP